MSYTGEIISLIVACMWTITALASEIGTKRLGVIGLNVWRLGLATVFTAILLLVLTGSPYPVYADGKTWLWMSLSGFVGFFLGDWCLFKSYIHIGSRYGQLFMTLAPAATAIAAWITLGQNITAMNILAMAVTLTGIAITVLGRGEGGKSISVKLPLKGILLGIGAGIGQGCGLVLSKIGMNHYTEALDVAGVSGMENVVPFASNMIRCITGFICFALVILLNRDLKKWWDESHDRKGMSAMLVAVIFGPFIGVALSLMAVQFTVAGIASTLMALTPILIILPSHWLFKTPINAKGIIGAVISCIGVSLFFLI